ncbi:hypothetical protein [Chitinophaga sp. YIM B06452]|uniref:hypothetical protein n=1 Tax=Chitinophaga sp. YIM B06452 TaxID=3082158 RepID=UPI0031FEED7B
MYRNQLRFFEDLLLRDVEAALADKKRKLQDNFNDAVIEWEKISALDYLRDLRFHIHKAKQLSWIINTYFERVIELINRVYQIMHPCTPCLGLP